MPVPSSRDLGGGLADACAVVCAELFGDVPVSGAFVCGEFAEGVGQVVAYACVGVLSLTFNLAAPCVP